MRMSDWPPDVVVHEEGEYAAPVAAARAGFPWVTHGWGSPLRSARELAEIEDLASALWESCGRDVPVVAGLYAYALLNPCPPMLQDQPPPGASVVWPVRPRRLEGRGPALEADAYIGFGTVPSLANARSHLTAAVRACTSRGMRVVVTAPSEQLRRELAELDERLVQAREFVSLPGVLSSCKVVISHAGAGTVLASLAAGVRGAHAARHAEPAAHGRRMSPGWGRAPVRPSRSGRRARRSDQRPRDRGRSVGGGAPDRRTTERFKCRPANRIAHKRPNRITHPRHYGRQRRYSTLGMRSPVADDQLQLHTPDG